MKTSYLKKLTFIFTFIFVFSLVFSAVYSTAASSGKKPVKIGLLTPLSPPGDQSGGQRILWGVKLGVKYINEELGGVLGGRPVELIVADDKGTPAEGIAAFRKLVQRDGVCAVVGQYHSSVCLAVNKVAKDLGIPLFAVAASSAKITESQFPTIFRVMSLDPDRAKLWIEFAKKMGWKRVAILTEDTDWGTSLKKWVVKWGTDEGLEIKPVIFPRVTTDLTPVLLETKAWKPDVVFNGGLGNTAYIMVKQAHDLGLFPKVPMFALCDWPAIPEFWDAVGDKGKYIFYEAYYRPGMKVTPAAEWMISRYKKLYKEDPIFYPINAFGETLIIGQAINKAKSDKPEAIIKALTRNVFQDWSGEVKFEEKPGMHWHNSSTPILILQATEARQPIGETALVYPPKFGGDLSKIVLPSGN